MDPLTCPSLPRDSDALEAGDPIRAVIRETYLNQDGKTETITSPSQPAQVELMRECYRRAGLSPNGTQYFEAHGTGTPTGDPIEARSIAAVFGPHTKREAPLLIGSVKSNIGHTEAASGLAGLIKAVLAMEKGQIPPSINYEKPNPKIKLDEWGLKVATSLEAWPTTGDEPRRASINNFGYGGTNSHVILEDASQYSSGSERIRLANGVNGVNGVNGHSSTDDKKNELLVFFGRDEQACQRSISGVGEYLQKHRKTQFPAKLMQDLSWTLSQHRTKFPSGWMSAHVVQYTESDLNGAIQSLEASPFKPIRVASSAPRIGMVFTGQGAQWHAMARELIAEYPVFRAALEEADTYLKEFGADWSLTEELMRDAATTKVNTVALSIPICVAVQIALVRLLETWGIKPAAVTSHSSGEISAAYAVGALNLRQAMAAGYFRAAMAAEMTQRKDTHKGAMVAVGVGSDGAQAYLNKLSSQSGKAVAACINSPSSVTIAGDEKAVQAILDMANGDGVFARRLKVDTAYHSHHMNPIAEPYRQALRTAFAKGGEKNKKLDVIFSSPVTGGRITQSKQLADPEHWVGSLLQPVQFVDSFTDMVLGGSGESGSNIDMVLEVGPHTALGGPIKEVLALPEFGGLEVPYVGCLVRNEDARDCMMNMAATLIRKSYQVDFAQLSSSAPGYKPSTLSDLPSYPWNHTIKHWSESRHSVAYRNRVQGPHHLLGMPVPGANPDSATWRQIVRVSDTPWLRDHVVQGNILYPGAGYLCLAMEAMKQLAALNNETPATGFRLRDIEIAQALVVPDTADGIELQTVLSTVSSKEIGVRGWKKFSVTSVNGDSRWTPHAEGVSVQVLQAGTRRIGLCRLLTFGFIAYHRRL